MRPKREPFRQAGQTYFATFQTIQRKPFFRNERWAVALLDTIHRYPTEFDLHDFVIMHNHVHLLISPKQPLERSVQLIKGDTLSALAALSIGMAIFGNRVLPTIAFVMDTTTSNISPISIAM